MRILELQTDRLQLVIPKAGEAPAALDYFVRNKQHLAPTDPPLPKGFHTEIFWQQVLEKNNQEFQGGTAVKFFLQPKNNPEIFVGVANFTQIVRGPFQACYLGYSLDQEYEGKGYMREALQEGIRYMFEVQRLHRIMANHLPENQRSAQLLKRLGFHTEGRAEKYLFIHGQWQPHILNALVNSNWTPLEEDIERFRRD